MDEVSFFESVGFNAVRNPNNFHLGILKYGSLFFRWSLSRFTRCRCACNESERSENEERLGHEYEPFCMEYGYRVSNWGHREGSITEIPISKEWRKQLNRIVFDENLKSAELNHGLWLV